MNTIKQSEDTLNKSIIKDTDFIKKTKDILQNYNDKCLSTNGFRITDSEKCKKYILILGINPAGNEDDAKSEKNATYLYSLDEIDIKDRTYNKYYKPIFTLLSDATDGGVKWDWCNLSECDIEKLIEEDTKLQGYKEKISSYYQDYKGKKYSLCMGEFFYYHETSQSKFLELVDTKNDNYKNHYSSMLEMHIKAIIEKGHEIKAILIPNATAARKLCDEMRSTYCEIEEDKYPSYVNYKFENQEYRIFFSSMLSGQRAIDVFSRDRLCCALKQYLSE